MPKWPEWPDKPNISWLNYGTFDECRRKWMLNYASDLLPGEAMWDAKREAKLLPYTALAGQVVDDAISETLVRYRDTGKWEPDLAVLASGILRQYVNFTIRWCDAIRSRMKWPKGDNVQPIDRWWFGEPPTDDELKRVEERVHFCLGNFSASQMPDLLRSFPVDQWHCPLRTMETPPHWFMVDDTPVYAKYDFMIVSPGRTLVIDWKTGRKEWGDANAVRQLHWYAVYAHEDLCVPYDEMTLIPFWLSEGPEWTEHRVSFETVEQLRHDWVERRRLLAESVAACTESPSRMDELFPLVDDSRTCLRCQFRSCNGYRRAAGLQSKPQAFELDLGD